MPEAPPPLYKPELLEPKKKLTFFQHCYKEPWVPIGCLATVGCLSAGFAGFLQGNQKLMQQGMRGRVIAQGLTVVGMLAGIGFFSGKEKQGSALEN